MTRHYPDPGSAYDWLKQIFLLAQPIRSTTQIWVVTRHQYEISELVSQTSFPGETKTTLTITTLTITWSEIQLPLLFVFISLNTNFTDVYFKINYFTALATIESAPG